MTKIYEVLLQKPHHKETVPELYRYAEKYASGREKAKAEKPAK